MKDEQTATPELAGDDMTTALMDLVTKRVAERAWRVVGVGANRHAGYAKAIAREFGCAQEGLVLLVMESKHGVQEGR